MITLDEKVSKMVSLFKYIDEIIQNCYNFHITMLGGTAS